MNDEWLIKIENKVLPYMVLISMFCAIFAGLVASFGFVFLVVYGAYKVLFG